MADIDRLSIKLTADASGATRSINSLIKSLERLNKTLGSLDLGNINAFSHVVRELAISVSALSQSTDSIKDVARAFKDLSKSASSVDSVKKSTEDLSNTSTSLTVVGSSLNEVAIVSNALMAVFSRMVEAFRGISGGSQRLIGDMNVIDTTFREVTGVINEIVASFNDLISVFTRVISAFGAISGSNQKLIEESNIIDTTFREIVDPIDEAGNALNRFALIEDKTSASSAGLSDAFKKVSSESFGDSGPKSMAAATERANQAILILKASYSGFAGTLRKIGSMFADVAKKVLSAAFNFKIFHKAAQKATLNIPHATDLVKKFTKEITRVGKMLRLMITRMALRKVIEEVGNGFKSLALHSEEFNQSVSGMMNGAKKLGYSFSAMVSPLINAFAPAIQYVIDLLVKLLNILNQVFSVFAGKTTYNKSKDFSENWADNIKEANKNAKDLKKTVLGFDELNQLQDNKNKGGGAGDIVDMFETVEIDPKWKKFADWLKDMWKIGDFTELGTELGKKLRKMLESIPWDLIRKTANKLGGALATLINGFVEVEKLGYDIGYTIAQSINTVFEFLNGFVHKLHWDSIGKFIADTFNGFFENIDWKLIKDTVVTGMAGVANSIQTFIEEFHWDNISTSIINAIDTIVSGVRAFVEGIEWKDLGKKMGDQIRKSIEGIDWHDVGTAIGDIIQSAIDWVSGMLETMPSVETLIQKTTDLLHGLFDRVDFEQMGANLGVILQNVYDFLVGFWDENGEDIKNEVKKFFKGLWDNIDKDDLKSVLGKILGAALAVGIASAGWTALKIALTEKIKSLVVGAAGSTAVKSAGATAGATVAGYVVAGIVSFFVGAEIGKLWGKHLFPDDKELYEKYSGIKGTIDMLKDTVIAAYDLWVMKAEEAWKNLETVANYIKLVYALLYLAVQEKLDEIRQKLTEFKGHIELKIGELVTQVKAKIAELKGFVSDFMKDVKSFFSVDKWTFGGVKDGLEKTFKDAVKGVKGIWNEIAEGLNGEHEIGKMKFKIKLPKFAFAQGGFPEDGLFFANHNELVGQFSNGKTAVANNAQIVEGISAGVFNAVSAAMSRNGGSGNGYISNTIVVDGEVIARTITKAQDRQNMRYSPQMV